MECLHYGISHALSKIGRQIGSHPKPFILGSIIVSLCLGTGLLRFKYENNVETLYTYTLGHYQFERNEVETYFPTSSRGGFNPSRIIRVGRYGRLIILAKDGGTLLRKSVWNEIQDVDNLIHNISVTWKNKRKLNYSNLCGSWEGQCYENKFLELGLIMDEIENGTLQVSYPIMFNPETFGTYLMALNFGGFKLSEDGYSVSSVEAVSLNYVLAVDNEDDDERGYAWESKFLVEIQKAIPKWKEITVYHEAFKAYGTEQDNLLLSVLPYAVYTGVAMMLILSVTALSRDWAHAKPWAPAFGLICVVFGCIAGFGTMPYLGYPIISITSGVVFIMIGIGVDDTFVILAAWRQTDPLDSVPDRLAECYSEAGVSITITSLTDMFSFFVGLMTPILSVRIFSAYAGTCVLFIYLLQIFMFGAILAISGRQEAKNRHAVCWWRETTPKSKSKGKLFLFRLFCMGGIDRDSPYNMEDRPKTLVMPFFRDRFSPFLTKKWVQACVIGIFVVYIGISCYGVTTMEQGLTLKLIFHEDSHLFKYREKDEEYFREFPLRVQVLVTSPIDYSNLTVQNQIKDTLHQISSVDHMTMEYSENWLDSYTRYISTFSELYNLNTTTEQDFIDTLRGSWLNGSSSIFKEDIKFNHNFTKIIASRFILQAKNLRTPKEERNLIVDARAAAAQAQTKYNFKVTLYNSWFHFGDQYLIIGKLTAQLVATATAVVMVIVVLFIPNLVCSLAVFMSIVTIELGVLGFMCLWGISLNMISLLGLIMSIGFSVDFVAHVAYAYISAEGTSENRVRHAMASLGLPILQGGLSTIFGMFVLFFIRSYSFRVFAKLILLVILIATAHGLFFLPVFMLIVRPEQFSCKPRFVKSKIYTVNEDAIKGDLDKY